MVVVANFLVLSQYFTKRLATWPALNTCQLFNRDSSFSEFDCEAGLEIQPILEKEETGEVACRNLDRFCCATVILVLLFWLAFSIHQLIVVCTH